MFLLSLGILAGGIFLEIESAHGLNDIANKNTKYGKIQLFELNMNRINSVLRDIANGLYLNHNRQY